MYTLKYYFCYEFGEHFTPLICNDFFIFSIIVAVDGTVDTHINATIVVVDVTVDIHTKATILVCSRSGC